MRSRMELSLGLPRNPLYQTIWITGPSARCVMFGIGRSHDTTGTTEQRNGAVDPEKTLQPLDSAATLPITQPERLSQTALSYDANRQRPTNRILHSALNSFESNADHHSADQYRRVSDPEQLLTTPRSPSVLRIASSAFATTISRRLMTWHPCLWPIGL